GSDTTTPRSRLRPWWWRGVGPPPTSSRGWRAASCSRTASCGKGVRRDEDRDDEHGPAETPPQGSEAADHAGRVRDGRPALRGRQRRPPGVPPADDRVGSARPGAAGGRVAAEGGPVPDGEDAGGLRLAAQPSLNKVLIAELMRC